MLALRLVEISINVDGSTNPGAWVHPYEDGASKKEYPGCTVVWISQAMNEPLVCNWQR